MERGEAAVEAGEAAVEAGEAAVEACEAAPAAGDEGAAGACQLERGFALDPETARRLACDASLVRILERDGRPLSVGRRTRSVPPALRRALQSRDRRCRFPGCCQLRFLHAHHIDHWAHGGPTELSNLVQLCRYHHRLVHEGGYTLERAAAGGLRFRRPDGRPIPPVPDSERGEPGEIERRNHSRRIPIGPDTCVPRWWGDRLDLALSIDCIVSRDPRMSDDGPQIAAWPAPDIERRTAEAHEADLHEMKPL